MLPASIRDRIANLKTRFERDISSKPALWVAAVLVAGFLAFYFDSTDASSDSALAQARRPEGVEAAATYIPEGYVLVPIEVSNFEALDSLLGKHGIVDLYLPADEFRKKPYKIADHVKILRAPLNPSHFAVLVTEDDSPQIAMQAGPFIVVVQPSNSKSGTRVESGLFKSDSREAKPKRTRRSRIEIEGVVSEV